MNEAINLFQVRRTEIAEPKPQTVADIEDFRAEFPFVANPYCAADSLSLERERKVVELPRTMGKPNTAEDAELDAFFKGVMAGVVGVASVVLLLIGAVI
ncbi:MAG: hypothetical protein MJ074_07670 [Oscillospiraceae bacterium]|nr:hypothetical protein [Oscillospiraceae bacterium]